MTFTKEQREELRHKWVEALRSGLYAQCTHVIHNDLNESHCCIGVADIVARQNGFIEGFEDGYVRAQEVMGLKKDFGEYEGGSLVDLNDKLGKKFPEIADFIERKPKGLFVEDAQ